MNVPPVGRAAHRTRMLNPTAAKHHLGPTAKRIPKPGSVYPASLHPLAGPHRAPVPIGSRHPVCRTWFADNFLPPARRSNNRRNLTVGESFPYQSSDLHFFCRQALTGLHACSLRNIAVASFTRLRPSRIPALRNNVRRCCLTVLGLMCNSSAISRLLHP